MAPFRVAATGDTPVTYTETGALPTGVTLSAHGLLSGKAPKRTEGSYPLVLTATDVHGASTTQSFTLTVAP